MKQVFLLVALTFQLAVSQATEAGDFLTVHTTTFHDLHAATLEFDQNLLYAKDVDHAKKTVDDYSLKLEAAVSSLSVFKQSSDAQITEVSTDLVRLLSDVIHNNYELLGKLVEPDYVVDNLEKDGLALVNKNRFATGFVRDISLGVLMTVTKDRPKKAKETEQFSKLTKTERDGINELLIGKYGKSIKKGKQVESKTPFEFSARLVYEYVNMDWVFEKKK